MSQQAGSINIFSYHKYHRNKVFTKQYTIASCSKSNVIFLFSSQLASQYCDVPYQDTVYYDTIANYFSNYSTIKSAIDTLINV